MHRDLRKPNATTAAAGTCTFAIVSVTPRTSPSHIYPTVRNLCVQSGVHGGTGGGCAMDRRPVMVDGGVRAASAALRQSPWIHNCPVVRLLSYNLITHHTVKGLRSPVGAVRWYRDLAHRGSPPSRASRSKISQFTVKLKAHWFVHGLSHPAPYPAACHARAALARRVAAASHPDPTAAARHAPPPAAA